MTRARARIASVACAIGLLVAFAPLARADSPSLECEDERCPANVALLLRRTALEELRCTAFLVATDTLMTARHCIEPTRRDGGRSLDATFVAVFPAAGGHAAESIGARLFRMAEPTPLAIQSANDWAVLRLERPTGRAPLAFDREGFDDDSPVTLLVVDAVDEGHARLRSLSCRTVLASIFAPHVDERVSPVVTLAGCDVRAGHSGAPVLDEDGRVRALVHARDARAFPWRSPIRYPAALAGAMQRVPTAIAYATNLACVDWGRPGPTLPSCRLDDWLERTRHPGDAASVHASSVLRRFESRIEGAARELGTRDPDDSRDLLVFRDGTRARVVARSRCGPDGAAFDARRIAIVVDAAGRPIVVEHEEHGVSRALCRERVRA